MVAAKAAPGSFVAQVCDASFASVTSFFGNLVNESQNGAPGGPARSPWAHAPRHRRAAGAGVRESVEFGDLIAIRSAPGQNGKPVWNNRDRWEKMGEYWSGDSCLVGTGTEVCL
jgi:hypothetical protein